MAGPCENRRSDPKEAPRVRVAFGLQDRAFTTGDVFPDAAVLIESHVSQ